ncbi:nose resistant to fluoxetine protein 6 isoform X2 [Parasteatoda tepidariorum]|uniref:nose resistant to fluoxetine protein 6 isoform X2 n=1 Tax=Parasteatoda tepidariorum TaxID=114398 RepID=UPI00077FD18C|nr:nose resistant to fluoxetine protein 6 isoform X2 [Parasteatoda tepidariorum]
MAILVRILACLLLCLLILPGLNYARDRKSNKDDLSLGDPLQNPNHPDHIFAKWNASDHEIIASTEKFAKKIMAMAIRSGSEVQLSGPCMSALFKLIQAIRKQAIWAYKLVDAWGKPGAGMFEGNLGHIGDYDECINLEMPDMKDPDGNEQRGMYCLSTFVPLLPKKPQLYTLFHKIHELEPIVRKNTSFGYNAQNAHWFYFLELRMGLCMPSACTKDDVLSIAEQIPKHMNIKGTVKMPTCETKQPFTLSNEQMAVVAVIALFLVLMIIGTTLDVITILRQGNDPEPLSVTKKTYYKALVCFSVYTNYLKLINVDQKEDSKHLAAVNGVRYITVTWVIVGHSYLYADYNQMNQAMRLSGLPPNFAFQIIANAMLTVDTFIMMSGMLVTYGVLKSQEKRKGLNIPMYIFHRFWRLTPPYAMTIGFLILSPVLGSGPVWKVTLDPLIANCRANWWTNLLYVNNYVNTYDFCLEHTWYLGVDMQLHILGLCVLLPLIRWPKLAAVVGVVLTVGMCAIAAIVNLIHDLPPSPLGLFPDPDDRIYVEVPNYFKPYGHAAPYFVGMLLGYILIKKPKIVIPRSLRILGWLFFTALQLFIVYIAYPWNNENVPGPTISALYAGTSKLVWSLGIFWMLFTCCTGNGGIVNDILSWKFWTPMARLSYVFYLVHPLVIWVHEAFGHSNMYTSHYFWVYNILGHYMISMVLSLAISLTFEAPFLAMEKILFGRGGGDHGDSAKRNGHSRNGTLKNGSALPSYDSEMRPHTFTAPSKSHYTENHSNGYRNGGDGLYRPTRENGHYKSNGHENGAFCRL